MKRILFFIIALGFLVQCAYAVTPRDMTFPSLEFEPAEPIRFEAPNGLVVYFHEDHDLPVVSLSAYFHGGDIYDPSDKIGLTAITATVMRSGGAGTRTPDQVDFDLDYLAARISSGADEDYLSLNLSCLRKDFDTVLAIFSDILLRPAFDSAKLALELSNTRERILRRNDDPGDVTRRIYYQTLYAGHPYGNYPSLKTIDNITADDVRAQYDRYYHPDNCILAVSGDLTLAQLQSVIDQYFGDWPRADITVTEVPKAAPQYQPGVYYVERDINQAQLRFGQIGIDDRNPDRYALDILNFAMGGGGFSSRLTMRVRTTAGLAYSVGSYLWTRPLGGTWFGYCQTRADAMSKAAQMMLDIMNEVKENGITTEEMELAKESIVNSYVFQFDTPSKIVNAKARLELNGFPPDQLQRDLEAYQAVTLEDCNRVVKQYLDTKNIVFVITGNKELFDNPPDTFGPVTTVKLETQ